MPRTATFYCSLLLAGLGLAGCGVSAHPTALATRAGAMAARADWDAPIVLEDFDETSNDYEFFGPQEHPFFDPVVFTKARDKAAGSKVYEMLGPNRPKPRKGYSITFDVEETGTFVHGEGEKATLAPYARVAFKWGLNAPSTTNPALFVQSVFIYTRKDVKRAFGLAYAWTNRYAPGTILTALIGDGENAIATRIICLSQAPSSIDEPCSDAALNHIPLAAVERDFCSDVRWANSVSEEAATANRVKLTPTGVEPLAAPDADSRTENWPCPPQFIRDGNGKLIKNTFITGIAGVGAGADLPQGICSHGIVDDFTTTLRWKD